MRRKKIPLVQSFLAKDKTLETIWPCLEFEWITEATMDFVSVWAMVCLALQSARALLDGHVWYEKWLLLKSIFRARLSNDPLNWYECPTCQAESSLFSKVLEASHECTAHNVKRLSRQIQRHRSWIQTFRKEWLFCKIEAILCHLNMIYWEMFSIFLINTTLSLKFHSTNFPFPRSSMKVYSYRCEIWSALSLKSSLASTLTRLASTIQNDYLSVTCV